MGWAQRRRLVDGYGIDPAFIPTSIAQGTREIRIAPTQMRSWRSRLRFIIRFSAWLLRYRWRRMQSKGPTGEQGLELAALLQDLGGLAVKIGQLLSIRPDVFSEPFCEALAHLQFDAVGFSPELARRTVEEELGRPIDEVFDLYEQHPFAAASVAQVHRARRRDNGAWVAIKVQRPGIVALFERDLRTFGAWIRFLDWIGVTPHMSWGEMMWELKQLVLEEVDYRYEAANTRKMRKSLRQHSVAAPKVYSESAQRILVMEFLPGVLMSDILHAATEEPERLRAWQAENDIDLERVGERLSMSFRRQVGEDNLFHGDLHPGNIMVFRRSRVGLIDFGSIGSIDRDTADLVEAQLRALAAQDYAAVADYSLLFVGRFPQIDPGLIKTKMIRIWREWQQRTRVDGLSYQEKAFTQAGVAISELIAAHKVAVSWTFMRQSRASVTLEASLSVLMPGADHDRLLVKYVRGAAKRGNQDLQGRARKVIASLGREIALLRSLQEGIGRNRAQEIQKIASKISAAASLGCALTQVISLAGGLTALLTTTGPTRLASTLAAMLVFMTARSLRGKLDRPEVFR